MALDAHRQWFLLHSWDEILVLAWKFCLNTKKKKYGNLKVFFFLPAFEEACRGNTRLRRGAGESRANIAPSMSGLVGLWPLKIFRKNTFLDFCPPALRINARSFPIYFQLYHPTWFDFPRLELYTSTSVCFLAWIWGLYPNFGWRGRCMLLPESL